MTEKFTIAKLTGSKNYASWAANLHIILKHQQHWSWIEGTNEQLPSKFMTPDPKSPNAQIDNPTYAIWEDSATDVLYHILMTCESNVKDQVHQINILSNLWKKLKNLYKP